MRVVCDNCSAVYKIPDEKLVKPVNKATCRNCGHRMLIPRPTAADEERTLVSNNPLTPAGAVPRGGSPNTSTDEPEQTLPVSLRNKAAARNAAPPPGRRVAGDSLGNSVNYGDLDDDDVPLMPGTPSPAGDRSGRPPRPRRGHRGKQPEEKTSWVRSTPPPQAPSPVSHDAHQLKDSEQPTRINPNPLTPEPAPPRAQDIDPSRDRAPAPAPSPAPAPAPAPAPSNPYPMPSTSSTVHHNPSGDLFLALLGIVASLLFTAMVSLNVSFGSYALDTLFQSLTLLVAFAGGFTAMFVIITGSRGRKPARQAVSILLSVLLAILCVSVIQGVKYTAANLNVGAMTQPMAQTTPEQPADASIASTVPETDDGKEGTEDGSADASPEADASPKTAAPKPRSTPRSRSTSSSSSSSRPSSSASVSAPPPERRRITVPSSTPPPSNDDGPLFEDDDPLFDDDPPTRSAPPPPPPSRTSSASSGSNSGAMDAVPMEVIDVMLRNNIDVKKCFFTHMQSAGALPPRVDVRFTMEPTGRVSSAGVTQSQFAGTALDSCLGTAIKSIQFPATSGPARKITFPFIFQ